ncbi:hypothetical protein Tco_1450140, partial [Tanacetum coccineum]
MLEDFSSNSK